MPIGAPSYSPEPKSGCTLPPAPIALTIAAELLVTGNLSTRWFHGLFFGKTAHFVAPVTGCPAAMPATADAVRTARAMAARRIAAFWRPGRHRRDPRQPVRV